MPKKTRYKIGDRVRVRTDLKHDLYNGLMFVEEMDKYKGKILTVSEVDPIPRFDSTFYCKEPTNDESTGYSKTWIWNDSMVALVETMTADQVNDIIKTSEGFLYLLEDEEG